MKACKNLLATQIVYICFASILAFILASCGGNDGNDSSTTSNFGSLSGNYVGTGQNNIAGTATIQVSLAQDGSSVTGVFQSSFPNPQFNNSGALNGTVNGTTVTLTSTPSVPTSCPANLVLQQISSTQLTGTSAAFNCSVVSSATFTLTRQ
jgi:hypothetical protein